MSSVDSKRKKIPFGGINIVFGGDFWQILPVIPKASRSEVVTASLNQSRLWEYCKVFVLRTNMRLGYGKSPAENKKLLILVDGYLMLVMGRKKIYILMMHTQIQKLSYQNSF